MAARAAAFCAWVADELCPISEATTFSVHVISILHSTVVVALGAVQLMVEALLGGRMPMIPSAHSPRSCAAICAAVHGVAGGTAVQGVGRAAAVLLSDVSWVLATAPA